ncbi:DNA cytosine methyltransferase [Helicobacter suis]
MGYKIYHSVLNTLHFGVPQIRQRVFVVGIGISKTFYIPTTHISRELHHS